MMQTLSTGDIVRCILFNQPKGPNLAYTMQGLTSGRAATRYSVWKETLAQRHQRVTVARWDGVQLAGLVSAHVRSGHRAWEIDQLFLSDDQAGDQANDQANARANVQASNRADSQDRHFYSENGRRGNIGQERKSDPQLVALEILEYMVQQAGESNAERVFLRLPFDTPIFAAARRAGFFPRYEEVLLESRIDRQPGSQSQSNSTLGSHWEELSPEDNYSLFQLYCAATPQPVRTAVGLTFDQWRDSQEYLSQRRSWVSKRNGKVVGWLGLSRCGRATAAEAMAHPEFPELWEGLVERALYQGGLVRWLVPDYQEPAAGLPVRRQFHDTARYLMMIKTVAVPVGRPEMATVEA